MCRVALGWDKGFLEFCQPKIDGLFFKLLTLCWVDKSCQEFSSLVAMDCVMWRWDKAVLDFAQPDSDPFNKRVLDMVNLFMTDTLNPTKTC